MLRRFAWISALLLVLVLPLTSSSNTGGIAIPSHGCVQGVSQPAPAAAFNLNCLVIYETWPSAAVIDGSDTRAAGFHWYVHNGSTQGPNNGTDNGWNFGHIQPTPTTDWSWTTPGQVTLGPAVNGAIYDALPIMFSSCAQQGTSQSLVGTTFGPSFYVDIQMSRIDTGLVNSIDVIAWMVPTAMMIGGVNTTQNVFEPDIFEGAFGFFIHDWNVVGQSSANNVSFSDSSGSLIAPITMGLRAIAARDNGGTTAIVDRYHNDILNPSGSCTSITTTGLAVCNGSTGSTIGNVAGTYSDLNNMQYCLALSGGAGTNEGIFQTIQVWTK